MEYVDIIKQLLDKYFAGETTLAEEKSLREFFSSDDVPEELQYAKVMFGYFAQAACCNSKNEIAVPATATKTLKRRPVLRRLMLTVSSVAAIAIVAFTVSLSLSRRNTDTVYCYLNGHPVEDMDLAREQSRVALTLLSDAFNTSTSTLKGLNVTVDDDNNNNQ